jgi:hypothetical protein
VRRGGGRWRASRGAKGRADAQRRRHGGRPAALRCAAAHARPSLRGQTQSGEGRALLKSTLALFLTATRQANAAGIGGST